MRRAILPDKKLIEIGNANDLYRINIFNNQVIEFYPTVFPNRAYHGEENINRYEEIEPVLERHNR